MYQLNVEVQMGQQADDAVPVVVYLGGMISQIGVTMAVAPQVLHPRPL